MNRLAKFVLLPSVICIAVLCLAACSGGGGSDSSDDGGNAGGGGGGVTDGSAEVWRADAAVSVNGCNERIANVKQNFSVVRDGDTVIVDDGLITASGVATADGFTVSFQSAIGDCVKSYNAVFSGMTDSSAAVNFSVKTACGAAICENQWTGTAVKTSAAAAREAEALGPKVSGERCVAPIPQVGFRPSLYECFGNSAVLARDFVRNNYSVVVRRDGQYNDRDPANPTCGTNRCSPYKTQQKIELPEYQVNCLGDSGYSTNFSFVKRISIKFTAQIIDKNDPSQFEQYCLNSKTTDLN